MTRSAQKGNIYVPVMIVVTLFVSLAITGTTFVLNQAKLSSQLRDKEIAFQMAEAGLEYYRWHLAHEQTDYQDGTGAPGPYIHNYTNTVGEVIGQFSLDITAPPAGSTVVQIESSGYILEKPKLQRKVKVTLGIPSYTNYAVAANDQMRFGVGTEVFGPIHSNLGIRFDGYAHNLVSSSDDVYDDPDHNEVGTDPLEWAVHTHVSPTDPIPSLPLPQNPVTPYRPDVFGGGRRVLAPTISFTGISGQLDDMEDAADDAGITLPASGAQGYYLHFNTDNTVNLYRVNSQATCQRQTCYWFFGWHCWSSNYTSENLYSYNPATLTPYVLDGSSVKSLDPASGFNGIIFVKDDVWVGGKIDGSRVTVVAAEPPNASGMANLIINEDLEYTNYDGTDAFGLIAQNNIYVGFFSEGADSGTADQMLLRVDAALIAQKGMVGRPYYGYQTATDYVDQTGAACGNINSKRNTITSYGAIATNQRYGFAWTGSNNYNCGTFYNASGYCTRNLYYDENFYFAPPPFFPTTGRYRVISWWEED
ncbi:MAG: pilus assembly PilX N-terminal domain-containing protein [Patescibacteria group bacterium]